MIKIDLNKTVRRLNWREKRMQMEERDRRTRALFRWILIVTGLFVAILVILQVVHYG